MVYYISSPKYQPMIQKILAETEQLCTGNQTGEDIYLKKFVKENMMLFEQLDILLIDLTALQDTDAEILQVIDGIRVMDYRVRFIFLAPYKKEGDSFLKECFYAGIYDLIITDEYLQMSEQLALCITEGMRYKDALRFRDAASTEEMKTESLAVQKILVGVAGAGPRMGSTHNSIVLANFLRENKQMVAIMEMNASGAFEALCDARKAKVFPEGYFTINGVDYYPACTRERVATVSGKLYNFILLDFGSYYEADRVQFNKCDVRILFSGTKPWELGALEELFEEQEEDVLKKYHFCFLGTSSGKLQKEIIEHMEPLSNVWFPEYTEEPVESSHFPEGREIFKMYLNTEPKEAGTKKKGFFKRSR